ncbi:MAG: multidrug resistance efflux transporter family protein [Alicyclobacillus sp.]|nr:multidrug resistance efflux transporter family protein [Alicyclobacillus sp.]
MKAVMYGIAASFFFSVTFVLNRWMSNDGGSWIWSASLRYLFMLPLLLAVVMARKQLADLARHMRRHPWPWLAWSLVGFGLFYAPLCFAAAYSPAWLVAGTWQFTIVAGSLLVPLFRETRQTANGPIHVRGRIPFRSMRMSLVIFLGIVIMEGAQASHVSLRDLIFGTVPVLIATFAYPLGNRKMMALCSDQLDAVQRTLGMTIASLPLWILLAAYQGLTHGLPSGSQSLQSLVVALLSGVIATVLFFTATDLARKDVHQLSAVEATQSGEVVFTLFGELLVIPGTHIGVAGAIGLTLVVLGMVLHSFASNRAVAASEGTLHM